MEYAGIAITLLGLLFAAAVAWGQITTRVEENKKEVERMCAEIKRENANMEEKVRQCVGKEHCVLKHEYIGNTLNEMRDQLKEIRNILKELNENRS